MAQCLDKVARTAVVLAVVDLAAKAGLVSRSRKALVAMARMHGQPGRAVLDHRHKCRAVRRAVALAAVVKVVNRVRVVRGVAIRHNHRNAPSLAGRVLLASPKDFSLMRPPHSQPTMPTAAPRSICAVRFRPRAWGQVAQKAQCWQRRQIC